MDTEWTWAHYSDDNPFSAPLSTGEDYPTEEQARQALARYIAALGSPHLVDVELAPPRRRPRRPCGSRGAAMSRVGDWRGRARGSALPGRSDGARSAATSHHCPPTPLPCGDCNRSGTFLIRNSL
ncbi:hypothetical protein ACFVYE_11985 [Streptomyces sp. NPDC058239]|uniref:hypothetical protein n=1 Tax=unclassified Streptomyces TaxID=2593676 RepID=UPI003648E29F